MPDAPQELVPPQLLTEILGFSPQLLLDDIINAANHAVQDGVNGVEDYLQQRAEERGEGDDSTQEVEQGLVAFQTLLEFHTDVAFDFFEAWSLRNIFAVHADLPLVLPHHKNIDLTQTPERERELMDEVEELRNRLETQRRLKHQLVRANRRKTLQLGKARKAFDSLAPYEAAMDTAKLLPARLMEMYASVSTLPELEPVTLSALSQLRHTEAGKRQWEMGTTGYINWVISHLLVKAKEDGGEELFPDLALNAEAFRKATAAMDSFPDSDGDVAMGNEQAP
ncbi:Mis12 protein-domain-containing protein [Mycena maculata]|uniref:Mis12 protein-domain-containing protein n=1 Tax=Mycena maculata TaxID=230809 RepID=A0AAD7I414_9AGAR|nr:Mis12 protein-domain-containing protein [Mycena maculata]